MTRFRAALACWGACLAVALGGCASPAPTITVGALAAAGEFVIVAVADRPEAHAVPGATPRADYRQASGYAGSDRARALAQAVAVDHGLSEMSAWTIDALGLRCMLYRVAAGTDRAEVLAALERDPRVQLAQPLNRFDTLAEPGYNDPYLHLQRGFAAIDAAAAHRWSRGERVKVAVIDTDIDAGHSDFGGRVTTRRDFVGGTPEPTERHGTQVAGVIAAAANNGIGIAGVAPLAEVLSYRACWAAPGGSRCNSYSLAQALGAAIAAGADVINLSLWGPRDPLLERLTLYAIAHGSVVVGAAPSGAHAGGFPTALAEVLAVSALEDGPPASGALAAPGRDILTLMPGGAYDFASGSSMAAAHVSGTVALLRGIDGRLTPAAVRGLLGGTGAGIDACRAVQRLRPSAADSCTR